MNRLGHAPTPAKTARALRGTTAEGPRFQMPPKHPACGKRRCADEAQAVAYVLWLSRKSKDPLRIYPCDGPGGCAGLHVTKKPLREDQR